MDLGLQDRTTDLNLGEPRKTFGEWQCEALSSRTTTKTKVSKLMLGNFFSNY